MSKRTEPRQAKPRPHDDGNRVRVRHIRTGDVGTLHGVDRPDEWAEWALVRWDDDGPGMVDARELSRVAPGVLERVSAEQRHQVVR